jgi:streptogramin lyase
MSLRKLCLFTLAATIAGFATTAALNVQIQEYEVPTPHSRPHDPALAPDGSLWYTGQGANRLGRLDPKSGKFKEYPLKTLESGPHGLVADKDGNIWFTAISGVTSVSSTRILVWSSSIDPQTEPRSIPTLPCSTITAFCGSPTKRPTMSGGSIRKTAR